MQRSLFGPSAPVQSRLGLSADETPRRNFWETYRPQTLAEVVGQDDIVTELRAFAERPYPVALLFSGETGTGKTSTALALAHDLGVNVAWDFLHVKSGGMDLEAVEQIERQLRFVPACGWRVVLIDEADQATAKAKQVMLSLLESIPARTVLICTSNHPEKFDQRTLDRMTHFAFASDLDATQEGAQRLCDTIWQAETGGTDGPDVATLPNVVQRGSVSFRRVVGALQDLVRAGVYTKPEPAPVEQAPVIETPSSDFPHAAGPDLDNAGIAHVLVELWDEGLSQADVDRLVTTMEQARAEADHDAPETLSRLRGVEFGVRDVLATEAFSAASGAVLATLPATHISAGPVKLAGAA